jgi:hypothetical protein
MLWTKEEIVALAMDVGGRDGYGNFVVNEDQASHYYDEVINEIASHEWSPLTGADQIRCYSGQAVYDLPADCRYIHAIFYDYTHLARTDRLGLEAWRGLWRFEGAYYSDFTPTAWTTDREEDRTVRIFPTPLTNGAALSTPREWGEAFPREDLSVIYSQYRTTNIGAYLVLYLVFRILAFEFARLSDHQDLPFSQLALEVAAIIGDLIGIKTPKESKASEEV